MNIKIINFREKDNVALVVFEEQPKRTYVVKIDDTTTMDSVKAELKSRFKEIINYKDKFDSLNLKSLEGIDINA